MPTHHEMRLKVLRDARQNAYEGAQYALQRASTRSDGASDTDKSVFESKIAEVRELDREIAGVREDFDSERRAMAAREALGDLSERTSVEDGRFARGWLPSTTEARDLQTDGDGAALVPVEQARKFFDRLRGKSVVLGSGVEVMEPQYGEVRIPKLGSSASAAWVAEGGVIGASNPVYEGIDLVLRKVAALVWVSSESMTDSAPHSVRRLVADDLEKTLAGTLDVAMLAGDGSGATPTGILNTAGVNTTSLGTDGAVPTLDNVADALSRLEAANAAPNALFMRPEVYAALRGERDLEGRRHLAPDVSAAAARAVFGVPVYTTTHLPVAAHGAATEASAIIAADTTQIVAGLHGPRIEYSTEAAFERDMIGVRAILRADVAVANTAAVEVISGALAAA